MSDVQLGVTKDGGSCELVDISLIDSLAIVYSSSSSSSAGHEGQSRPLWGVQFLRPGGIYGVSGDLSPPKICIFGPHLLMAGELSL